MLSLAEYQGYVNDITILGQNTDQQIADNIDPEAPKADAIQQAKSVISKYQQDFKRVMDQAMFDIASNTVQHYASQVKTELPEELAMEIVRDQYRRRYYGATLAQRLVLMRLRLNRVATQTAQVGVPHLGGLFSQPIPFGAQTNVSKRLLQGTAIKIEQDAARKIAEKADYPLIRWTLSKHHVQTCQCEALASVVNKNVVNYLNEHNIDADAEGLFFRDELPDPPHPNCQCEFDLVGEDEAVPSAGRRPIARFRRLIRKLLRS